MVDGMLGMLRKTVRELRYSVCEARARNLTYRHPIEEGYQRIYHYHIRKAAGTSLNAAFWNLANLDLKDIGRNLYTFRNGYVIVLNSVRAIEYGSYFFASSHNPSHKLCLPDKTFTIAVFRTPLERVLSYYRYLHFIKHDSTACVRDPFWKEAYKEARRYLSGSSFHDFLDVISIYDLVPQLYMFSSSFDIPEALDKAAKCSAILFTESFENDLAALSKTLNLKLQVSNQRSFTCKQKIELTSGEQERLQEMVEDETLFYDKLRSIW